MPLRHLDRVPPLQPTRELMEVASWARLEDVWACVRLLLPKCPVAPAADVGS